MIDIGVLRLIPELNIKSNKDTVYDYSVGYEISIEEIENTRISNKKKMRLLYSLIQQYYNSNRERG